MKTIGITLLAALCMLSIVPTSEGAGMPAQKCEAAKLKASGKLAACRLGAMAKLATGGTTDITKCSAKFSSGFSNAESKAGSGVCPTEGDAENMHEQIQDQTSAIDDALSDAFRFVTLGDGTVKDLRTGLQWELKTLDSSIHGMGNYYYWSANPMDTKPDGSVFTVFLATLNGGVSADGSVTTGCFAGKCDWRLPSIDELAGILDLYSSGACTSAVCTDIPGLTSDWLAYASSTTFDEDPLGVLGVHFADNGIGGASLVAPWVKWNMLHARAVRGGR